MKAHSLSHLSDGTLRTRLAELTASDRATTAKLLAHLGEFDARRLYAEDGYSSTFAYCVERLRFSEDMAFKRIRAARTTRRFPFFLEAITDGRLHLTGLVFLGPHLRSDNARELLTAATHKTKAEIEKLLAERFPQPDVRTLVRALPARVESALPSSQVVPEPPAQAATVSEVVPEPPRADVEASAPMPSESFDLPAAAASNSPGPFQRLKPLSPGRYALQATIDQESHDKLRRLQDLLGHAVPSGDIAQVLDRAFDALLEKLEKAKCGRVNRPQRAIARSSANPRYIPKSVRREVWKRDRGRCAFVSEHGQRCTETKFLEYDHVLEVSRGGQATVAGIRLLCRTHNQLCAERAFGSDFMRHRRENQRRRASTPFSAAPVFQSRAMTSPPASAITSSG